MEKVIIVCVLLGFYLTLTSGAQLFGVGEEYKYKYETLVIAGSEEPTSFASAYKLVGSLNVAAISATTLSISIDDLTVGLYNGPWTYFPIPNFKFSTPPELAPLGERFHIVLEDGKFKTLILNDQEPEWASNLKRGLATYLQMDMKTLTSFDKVQIFSVPEMTTMGECTTKYEVMPGSTTPNQLTRVSKFRNHADCPDLPRRARLATDAFYSCTDQRTKDIVNSSSYSTYELEVNKGQPLLKGFSLYSSLLIWPFTTESSFRYSWLNMTLSLTSHSKFGTKTFPAPENSENHEDLSYVFEQPDPTDTEDENNDLKSETVFFHQISVESDPEFYEKTQKLFQEKISELAESLQNSKGKDINEKYFQGKVKLMFLNLVATLDYDHLTQCYAKYLAAAGTSPLNLTEFQIFLDGLILSGTTPATLVLRDILLETEDTAVQARIAPLFPYYIRNPSEALVKEMDPIFDLMSKETISPTIRRMIGFSMASLIGRCCKKTLCVASGLLDKYVNHFENKLTTADNFGDRTTAILALGNLGQGKALDKVLDIAAGKLVYEQTVRVQAIWALKSLVYRDNEKVFETLLPVFYNRSESSEIRTTIFSFLMSVRPEKRILHQIAYFMWSETCPETANIVRSFLTNAIKSQSPCNKIGHFSRTILNYLPPGVVDPTRTTTFGIDYYDKDYAFGHQIQATVQKSGKAAFPISVYVGLNNYIGGYGSSYLGLFIRMEGVEKAIASEISALRSINVEEVQKILSKLGVTQRPSEALRLEFTLFYHGHAISHYAADAKTLEKIPAFLKKLTQLTDNIVFNWERTLTMGGIFYQQPMEIGTATSVFAGVTGTGSFSANFTKGPSGGGVISQDSSTKLQLHLLGYFQIANHAPAIGTMHTISAYKTFRMIVPRQITLGFDVTKGLLNIVNQVQTKNNPFIVMAHSTSETNLLYDSPSRVKDNLALELLQKSCPKCQATTTVSRGDTFRKSSVIALDLIKSYVKGVQVELKYFDCERDHSRETSLSKLAEYFSSAAKNTGFYDFPFTKLLLNLQHAQDYAFIAPYPETCGISLIVAQDSEASTRLTALQGRYQISKSTKPHPGKSTYSQKLIIKGPATLSLVSNLDFVYKGAEPSVSGLDIKIDFIGKDGDIREIKLKVETREVVKRVFCLNLNITKNLLPKDKLCFSGENEPILEEVIEFTSGKVTTATAGDNCPTDQAEIILLGKAQRSVEQIAEANSGIPPYSECQVQKASGIYPGPFVPSTASCLAAAQEQTNLRSENATITYKISEEVRNRWKRPFNFLTSLLQAYSVDESAGDSHHNVHLSVIPKTKDFYKGEVELNVNVKKSSPAKLDIHYRSSSLEKEEHFHGIDASLLPEPWRPQAVPIRFRPIWMLGLKFGMFGYCSVYPNVVQTLDGYTYPIELPNCQTLISADCGTKPQYAILAKRISPEKLTVTARLGELEVKMDSSDNIVVNGEKVSSPEREYATWFDGSSSIGILKNGDEISITSMTLGVNIRYTGSSLTVGLDSRYRGVHCGLCGQWDSTSFNDLVGPNASCPAVLTPLNLVKTYTIREGSCSTLSALKCPV